MIKLFEKIPTERWTTEEFNNETNTQFCALGHIGYREQNKSNQRLTNHLSTLFPKCENIFEDIYLKNDAGKPATAKDRVIKFLKKFI